MDFVTFKSIITNVYYAVPDYQRDYEWMSSQTETLKDDLFDLAKTDSTSTHFMGALVTVPYDKSNGFNQSINLIDDFSVKSEIRHVVDGQQRLTSLSIFCVALKQYIEENNSFFNNTTCKTSKNRLDTLLYGPDFDANDNGAPRLILNGNTGKCFNQKIMKLPGSQYDYNGSKMGARRIRAAYSFFSKSFDDEKQTMIKNGCTDAEINSFFTSLIKAVCDRITFVEIKCDESADAFQVFDSLNGKGFDLTAADRIKNVFLSWSKSNKGAEQWNALEGYIGEEYLTNFFLALLFYESKKRISKNKLPEKFKEAYKENATSDFSDFYIPIKEAAIIYGNLRNASTNNADVNKYIKGLQQLKSEQVYVLLFAVAFQYRANKIIDSHEFIKLINELTKLLVRMQVCERSMNKLDTIFSDCIDLIRTTGSSIKTTINQIENETKKITDEQFYNSFIQFAPSDSNVSLFYLESIENYLRKTRNNRTAVEDANLTVEHIIPKTLDDLSVWYGSEPINDEVRDNFKEMYLERLGNKTLLYNDDNASASNNTYQEKIVVYTTGKTNQNQGTPKGTFELIKELVTDFPQKFTDKEIEERSRKLADIALKIW